MRKLLGSSAEPGRVCCPAGSFNDREGVRMQDADWSSQPSETIIDIMEERD
jgi:hypothetical protein